MTSLGIFTLRSFAIYGRSKIVFLLLAAPALVDVSSGIWLTVTQTAAAFPPQQQIGPLNCGFNQSASNFTGKGSFLSLLLRFSYRPTIALLVNITSSAIFDVLVVIFTVYRTGRLALQSRQAKINGSLSFILLRDGMVYYSAIFIPQLVLVALNAVTLNTSSENLSNASNSLSYVNSSVQTVIVNRLVLNLCHAANTHEDSEFRTKTGLEPPVFATGPILGNIGGPVLTPFVDPDNEVFEGEGRVGSDEVEVTSRQPSSTITKEAENFSVNGIIEFHSSSDAGADSV